MDINQLNLTAVIEQVGKEKNIDRQILVSALEAAMLSAARKKLGPHADLEARFNEDVGEVEVYEFKQIVEETNGASNEISFADAQKLDPELTKDAIGEDLGIKLDSKEFGRIAAQNAKQIIVQRVREAERMMVFDEYKDRKDELVTGTGKSRSCDSHERASCQRKYPHERSHCCLCVRCSRSISGGTNCAFQNSPQFSGSPF